MSELLPCPFCGGEAETLTAESMNGGYMFGIMCNDCRSRGDVYGTEAEAIEAWNTRAERTCFADEVTHRDCKYSINRGWRERTCRSISDSNYFCCSACQKKTYRGDETFNYCPNCGAQVVGEVMNSANVADYANEIRELLRGDA